MLLPRLRLDDELLRELLPEERVRLVLPDDRVCVLGGGVERVVVRLDEGAVRGCVERVVVPRVVVREEPLVYVPRDGLEDEPRV